MFGFFKKKPKSEYAEAVIILLSYSSLNVPIEDLRFTNLQIKFLKIRDDILGTRGARNRKKQDRSNNG